MKESRIDLEMMSLADERASEVAQPSEGAPDFPPAPVVPQRPAILSGRAGASAPMRTDQFDVLRGQPAAQRIAFVSPFGDVAPRTGGAAASSRSPVR